MTVGFLSGETTHVIVPVYWRYSYFFFPDLFTAFSLYKEKICTCRNNAHRPFLRHRLMQAQPK